LSEIGPIKKKQSWGYENDRKRTGGKAMTHQRFSYLLISLLCFLLCVLILVTAARADDIEWHLAGYVTGNFAGGAGYSPGIGVQGQAQLRYKWIEGVVTGSTAWQTKTGASFGYTYAANGQLRAYVWRDLYLAGAYNFSGYESRFDNGTTWAKSGSNFGGGIGWEGDDWTAQAMIYNKEDLSPNKVWFATLDGQVRLYKLLWAMAGLKYMTFDQAVNGRTERLDALNCVVGLGVRW
jgi:hypothetical protein